MVIVAANSVLASCKALARGRSQIQVLLKKETTAASDIKVPNCNLEHVLSFYFRWHFVMHAPKGAHLHSLRKFLVAIGHSSVYKSTTISPMLVSM
jgi:hypothetical protein